MGIETQGAEPSVPLDKDLPDLSSYTPAQIKKHRLKLEAEYYTTKEGFLDFARDCGAAPDAQEVPHGKGAIEILNWKWTADPESERGIYKGKIQLWPRGSFKSAVFNVALVCWEIAKNPNIRICVCSETGKQAKKFVKQAMKIIDSQWFRDRFGAHRKDKEWREATGEFTSALRTISHVKESTLLAAGAGEVWTGSHWDLVLMDDVVSQENTKTIESLESMKHWFGEILAQLDPGCRILMIGTLHHFADLYCYIMKTREMRELFELSIHSWLNQDGSLFFPGRLTRAFVKNQKALMTPRMFSCFYENKPTTDEERIFKIDYFRVLKEEDIPSAVWTYLMTDWAFIAEERKKGRADRTAFWVVSIDANRVAYVRDFYVGRWKPSDSVRIACDLWDRYQHINMKGIIVEQVTHTELLSSLFEEIRRDTNTRPRIIPVPGRSQEIKEIRIESVEPRFRNANIYFSQNLRDQWKKWKPLIDEMTEWPFSTHDDIPDAISDIDKVDKEGKHVCQHPPLGFQSSTAFRHVPNMVNGGYNPDRGYPAEDFAKRDQQTGDGQDIWRNKSAGQDQPHNGRPGHQSSIFKQQGTQPRRWGQS